MDILQQMKSFIDSVVTGWRVTEQMPENVAKPYVWLNQDGETEEEALCNRVDTSLYSVEVVSTDIDAVRSTAATIKAAFRNLEKFSSDFEPNVEYWSVLDHDNNYVFRSIPQDAHLERAAITLTAHHVA